jgi:hypothetical protein
MANGQLIQLFSADPPLRNEAIHQGDEAGVVSRFQHVNHLVDDDVFEAFAWFLREIGVQSDARARQGWYGFDGCTPTSEVWQGNLWLDSGKTWLLSRRLGVQFSLERCSTVVTVVLSHRAALRLTIFAPQYPQ